MSNAVLLHGDCLEMLRQIEDNSVDSLVTDPPAGISFMGKEWDDDKGGRDQWVAWMTEVMTECMRVLKPGAHGLVWALPRTSHWTATALEDAGFEVRDVVTHLFGTGFPKSMDISKAIDKAAGAERKVIGTKLGMPGYSANATEPNEVYGKGFGNAAGAGVSDITAPATEAAKQWAGWGTALKPASEHWILVRKPCSEKTVAANVLKWGVGGINIDGSRIEGEKRNPGFAASLGEIDTSGSLSGAKTPRSNEQVAGRFPANLVLDEEAAAALDAQSGTTVSKAAKRGDGIGKGFGGSEAAFNTVRGHSDSGGASRFFYVAKASKSDKGAENTHPTVKSTALMTYLIKLVTPPGGVVLDPFMGSGSTGVSAIKEGFLFVGIEKSDEYYTICEKRIAASEVA